MDKEIEKEIKLQVSGEINKVAITAISITIAILLGIFSIVNGVVSTRSTATESNLTTVIQASQAKMEGKIDTTNARLDGLEKNMNAKFDAQMQMLQNIEKRFSK